MSSSLAQSNSFCLISSYEILCPNVIPKGFMDGKAASQKMVNIYLINKIS
jgi:hypothetical protein